MARHPTTTTTALAAALLRLQLLLLLVAPAAWAQNCQAVTGRFQAKMGTGYRMAAIATGLRRPRHLTVDSEGNLLVAENQASTVRRIVLRDLPSGEVCMTSSSNIAAANQGVALSADGRTLYTSTTSNVTAYPYDPVAGTVGAGKVLVTGLTNPGTHPTCSILTSKANPDLLYIARGSNANIDSGTLNAANGRSVIRSFNLKQTASWPVPFASGGELLGWGLRNIVGMGENSDGGIWSVENGMDDIRLNSRDVHNDNPAERMLYHGLASAASNPRKGLHFGYPSCIAAWEPSVLGISGLQVGDFFTPDAVPAPAAPCASRAPGSLHFPAHTAPLDVKFNANGTRAYVAFHGSWNRSPADGYRVMAFDFRNGQPVASSRSRTASIPVMENTNIGSCPGACFRPAGLAFDSKGRLFVSSDSSGEIYVVYGDS